jgi:hypothetical protein
VCSIWSGRPLFCFRAFLDAAQLMRPETFKTPGPLKQRPDSFRIRVIKLVPAVAPYPYQANIPQDSQMLRHRRLPQAEAGYDLAYRSLVTGQKL